MTTREDAQARAPLRRRDRLLEISETVDQPVGQGLIGAVDAAVGERVDALGVEARAARHHDPLEAIVHVVEHRLQVRALRGLHRPQPGASVLLVAGGERLIRDAELLHQAGDVDPDEDDADRAGHRGRLRDHLVGGHGDVVGAGGRHAQEVRHHRDCRGRV